MFPNMNIFNFIIVTVSWNTIYCLNFNLTVIHFNDFHARYEPITNASTTCQGHNCIGGFSRLYAMIMQLMSTRSNPLLLNAGDNFEGTLWHIVYKWNITQYFFNKLPLDAMTLGNHEFDDGIGGLLPFLNHINAPVVVSNIDDSKEPRIRNLYQKSVVIEKYGKKIGIIGVLTSTTTLVSHPENLIFNDESMSVNEEAKLLEDKGIFTNIVLSHCGYEADLEIAKKSTNKISLIVGGHTDTFLYTGTPAPGPDTPSGPYPTIVLNSQGNKVLIVQASAYSKYLGDITVIYDDFGNITSWFGAPIFLNSSVPSDPKIDVELQIWKKVVDKEGQRVVGNAPVRMPNKPCRSEECLLGNFATDAMVAWYIEHAEDQNSWTYVSMAMIHAGGMRAGIEKGDITFDELIATFPFHHTINICEIQGKHIKKILESSFDDKHLKSPHLFQVSGIHVVCNVTKPEGQRVQSLQIRCKECDSPRYENVVSEKYYRILLPTFLTDSGFNALFKKYIRNKQIGVLDSTVYIKYLSKERPLLLQTDQTEKRIKIVK